jgi:hypothetical protein
MRISKAALSGCHIAGIDALTVRSSVPCLSDQVAYCIEADAAFPASGASFCEYRASD